MSTRIEQALNELRAGNLRFVSGEALRPNTDKERLKTCIEGQHPFACILACSDSRVPVDLIFDRGVGDLSAQEVAGNVLGDDELGSVEYAVDHLQTPLLVIMGHNNCGMVKAVFEKGELQGRLNAISKKILPAVEAAKISEDTAQELGLSPSSIVDKAAKINVWNAIKEALSVSTVVRSRVKAGSCRVLGAFYWIEKGEVEWMGDHPELQQILEQ